MPTTYDTVIVGAGLAGVCAALHLSSRERILLLEAGDAPQGASSIAAGLVNPFMGRKGRPVWRYREALDALAETLELAHASDCMDASGLFRPATDDEQADYFLHAAETSAGCRFLRVNEVADRWSSVRAPLGGLLVTLGGAVNTPSFLRTAIGHLQRRGVEFRRSFRVQTVMQEDDKVAVRIDGDETLHAKQAILAVGAGLSDIEGIPPLNLHYVKGQTVIVDRADTPYAKADVPHLAGRGYVVAGKSHFTIGSSYQHEYANLTPDPHASREILHRARTMLPHLAAGSDIKEGAGVRVNVPGTRLPMIGPLPGASHIWVFTGLGSKGLLMAALIAAELPRYLDKPERIPVQTRVA